jgi:hypothetical protein
MQRTDECDHHCRLQPAGHRCLPGVSLPGYEISQIAVMTDA